MELGCEEISVVHEKSFVGKALYHFLARFAEKLFADFSAFEEEPADISFVGDENLVAFHLTHGYRQLMVGIVAKRLLASTNKVIFLIHCQFFHNI